MTGPPRNRSRPPGGDPGAADVLGKHNTADRNTTLSKTQAGFAAAGARVTPDTGACGAFRWTTAPTAQPVCPGWAHTRTWWAPLNLRSREQWEALWAHLLPEQEKQGCVFVIGVVEEITEIDRGECWVEERLAIGDMSLDQALALPVAGEA